MAVLNIVNINPVEGGTLLQDNYISFDVIDIYNSLKTNSLAIFVDGSKIYDGYSGIFSTPYISADSYADYICVDGYDGYHFVLDNVGLYKPTTKVRVIAQDSYGYLIDYNWTYSSSTYLNRLYYSDEYGVYKIDLEDLVGESQSVAERFLSTSTDPALPYNRVRYISGNQIDGYSLLILSINAVNSSFHHDWGDKWGSFIWSSLHIADGYGVKVVSQENSINSFSDGYFCDRAQINNRGVLYLINKTNNSVEVYYGANTRSGTGRTPDFVYDAYSNPPLFTQNGTTGDLLSLYVVNNGSDVLSNGTRLYVGQSIGMTIINAYDQEISSGYSANLESNGTSFSYGIAGSGATYEIIGGTVEEVVDISSHEESNILFVVTNDGLGHGGLTQILLSGNRQIAFMDEASGFTPSDDIRSVTKNE